MRLLYVSTSYPPAIGGAQIHLHCLATAVEALGNEVDVMTQWSSFRTDWLWGATVLCGEGAPYEWEGIRVSRLGFPFETRVRMLPWALAYYPLMGPAVRRIAGLMLPHMERRAQVPSLVHATRIGREFIAQASLDFARKNDIPFVLTPNHHPRWHGFVYREYDRIYREADALLALTSAEKQMLVEEKGVPEERVHVTGVGPVLSENFSATDFRVRHGLTERFVLYLGQQRRYKGIEAILKAALVVWRRHSDVRFVFIGPRARDSRKLFRRYRDGRVVNLGAVDIETKTSALAACEFLCVPSTQESFGGVYLEAWSLGKAVIGGRIPAVACVVEDGRDGLLSGQDAGELAGKISHLLLHPEKCREMGAAGRRKVQARYTWQRLASKTLDVYKQLRP